MKLGSLRATHDVDTDAELREARLRAARANSKWQELEAVDLIPRGFKGSLLVAASDDSVYKRDNSAAFERGSARIVSGDLAALHFFVDDATGNLVFLERMPWTWSEMVARKASRRAGAAA